MDGSLHDDIDALIARLADTNTAAVKPALVDAVARFQALGPVALSNPRRRARTGGVKAKKATTSREAHDRFWPAALWLGAHRHLQQAPEEFTSALTLQKGSTIERKITHIKTVLDRWGSDFWFQLRSAGAPLPADPTHALVDRLMQISAIFSKPADFAAQLDRDREAFISSITYIYSSTTKLAAFAAGTAELTASFLGSYLEWRQRPDVDRRSKGSSSSPLAKRRRLNTDVGVDDNVENEESGTPVDHARTDEGTVDEEAQAVEPDEEPDDQSDDRSRGTNGTDAGDRTDRSVEIFRCPVEPLATIHSDPVFGTAGHDDTFSPPATPVPLSGPGARRFVTPTQASGGSARSPMEHVTRRQTLSRLALSPSGETEPFGDDSSMSIANRSAKGPGMDPVESEAGLYSGALDGVTAMWENAKRLRRNEKRTAHKLAKAEAELNLIRGDLNEKYPELPSTPSSDDVHNALASIDGAIALLEEMQREVDSLHQRYAAQPDLLQAVKYDPELLKKRLASRRGLDDGLGKLTQAEADFEVEQTAYDAAKDLLGKALQSCKEFDERYRQMRDDVL